jgi:CDP-diglyceride synthetase
MTSTLFALVAGLFATGALLLLIEQIVHRPAADLRLAGWIKYAVFLLLIAALLLAAQVGRLAVAGLLAIIIVGGAGEIGRHVPRHRRYPAAIAAHAGLAVALGHLIAFPSELWRETYGLAIVLVATGDAFSQLWGRLLGRRRLCPALSPHKTVEGLLGGLLMVLSVALIWGASQPEPRLWRWGALGLLTALGGVAGDLLFSAAKRKLAVKDFAAVLPGHGGFLDRFDSLVVAAPVYFWSRACLFA